MGVAGFNNLITIFEMTVISLVARRYYRHVSKVVRREDLKDPGRTVSGSTLPRNVNGITFGNITFAPSGTMTLGPSSLPYNFDRQTSMELCDSIVDSNVSVMFPPSGVNYAVPVSQQPPEVKMRHRKYIDRPSSSGPTSGHYPAHRTSYTTGALPRVVTTTSQAPNDVMPPPLRGITPPPHDATPPLTRNVTSPTLRDVTSPPPHGVRPTPSSNDVTPLKNDVTYNVSPDDVQVSEKQRSRMSEV